MSDLSALLNDLSDEAIWRLENICSRFERSWQAGQRPRLEDVLPARESVEQLAVLRELVRLDMYYRRCAGEMPAACDYAARFPYAADLVNELFSSSEACLACATATFPEAHRTGPYLEAINQNQQDLSQNKADPSCPCPSSCTPSRSRFQLIRFHAAGALGDVFVAKDTELHREVALKEIKQTNTDHADSRARFMLEAEITGNLEHPGIVPVYGLGTYPDGRPYYAMRFIRGDNLATAIQHFHDQKPVRFDSLEFRQLLSRLVAVCQAIAYAHSRGVLHRDIKPGNIMLGKFGETLVVDWGLAKVAGRPVVGDAGTGPEGLLNLSGGDKRAQMTMGVVGTPAYMSPEQASRQVEELGLATDVYSLGATLYALLTNRAPFKGTVGEVLNKVKGGDWLPPRQINGAVPAALDAICRKAMALCPEERYTSALALSEDLEHWLGDEPVAAYPEPLGTRLRRWMRKRPRRVTGAIVLLLAALLGLTVGTVLLERSNRETRENLEMISWQAAYFREVSEDVLRNEPGMQVLRQRLLLKVLDDYGRLLVKRPGDVNARQQIAGAKRELGELYLQTSQLEESRALLDQAVDHYQGLLQKIPADPGLRFGLAQAHYALAAWQVQTSNPQKGKKEIDQALELLESLRALEPENGKFISPLARSYDLRAAAVSQQGQLELALSDNHRALEILVVEAPHLLPAGNPLDQRMLYRPSNQAFVASTFSGKTNLASRTAGRQWYDLAWPDALLLGRVCTNRGTLLSRTGRNGEAARFVEQAIIIHQQLLQRSSRPGQFRHGLALALLHSGRIHVQLGLPGQAERDLGEALEIMRQLVQDDPYTKEYQVTRQLAAGYLGDAQFRQGRTHAALELLREANKEGQEVLVGMGKNPGLPGHYGRLLHLLGCLEWESGNLERGLATCLLAQEKLQQAIQETPGDRSLRNDFLANRETVARCRHRGAPTKDAWIGEQQAILLDRQNLVNLDPMAPQFQGELAVSTVVLAGLFLDAGRPRDALDCVDRVLPNLEKALRTEHDRLLTAVQEQDRAEPLNPGNFVSLPFVLRKMPIVPDHSLQSAKAKLLVCRGVALAQVGRGLEAVESVQQAMVLTSRLLIGGNRNFWSSDPGGWCLSIPSAWFQKLELGYLYDLAAYHAIASTLPNRNNSPDQGAHLDQAMWLLRCSVTAGFGNLLKLRSDPALDPLRNRQDFHKVVHDQLAKDLERNVTSRNR